MLQTTKTHNVLSLTPRGPNQRSRGRRAAISPGRPADRPHFGIEQPVALVFSYKANVTDSNET